MKQFEKVIVDISTPKAKENALKALLMFDRRILDVNLSHNCISYMGGFYSLDIPEGILKLYPEGVVIHPNEFKQMLAVKFLKKGDLIVVKHLSGKELTIKFDGFDAQGYFLGDIEEYGYGSTDAKFIRFKNIESPNKLKIGKWYKSNNGSLFCVTNYKDGIYSAYGFNKGEWHEGEFGEHLAVNDVPATFNEVADALVTEAENRGSKCKKYEYDSNINILWGDDDIVEIFNDGKWAEIVKDKFADLKKAYADGVVIQLLDTKLNAWDDLKVPAWNENREYRVKPKEGPKVGDVCKFWDYNEKEFVIGELILTDISRLAYKDSLGGWYINAKRLSEQEVIELLFGKEAIRE